MEKRRFAGAGRSNQRNRLPGPQAKISAAQDFERSPRLLVAAFDLIETERRRRTWLFVTQRFDGIELCRAP